MSLTLSWFLNLDFQRVEKALAAAVSDHNPASLIFHRGLNVSRACAARLRRAVRRRLQGGITELRYIETVFTPLQGYVHVFQVVRAQEHYIVMVPMSHDYFTSCTPEEEGTAWISVTCPGCAASVKLEVDVLLRDPSPVGS